MKPHQLSKFTNKRCPQLGAGVGKDECRRRSRRRTRRNPKHQTSTWSRKELRPPVPGTSTHVSEGLKRAMREAFPDSHPAQGTTGDGGVATQLKAKYPKLEHRSHLDCHQETRPFSAERPKNHLDNTHHSAQEPSHVHAEPMTGPMCTLTMVFSCSAFKGTDKDIKLLFQRWQLSLHKQENENEDEYKRRSFKQ